MEKRDRWVARKNRRAAGGRKRTPQAVKECKNVGLARGNGSAREGRRARLAGRRQSKGMKCMTEKRTQVILGSLRKGSE